MRFFKVKRDVTIPGEEDISSEGIDVQRIKAYGGHDQVPAPTRLETPGHRYEVRSYWSGRS